MQVPLDLPRKIWRISDENLTDDMQRVSGGFFLGLVVGSEKAFRLV